MPHVVVFPMIFYLLCDLGRQRGVPKFMKNDHFYVFKTIILNILGCFGPFPQDFRQLQAQFILDFIKNKRVYFITAYPIVFLRSKYAGRSVKTEKNKRF